MQRKLRQKIILLIIVVSLLVASYEVLLTWQRYPVATIDTSHISSINQYFVHNSYPHVGKTLNRRTLKQLLEDPDLKLLPVRVDLECSQNAQYSQNSDRICINETQLWLQLTQKGVNVDRMSDRQRKAALVRVILAKLETNGDYSDRGRIDGSREQIRQNSNNPGDESQVFESQLQTPEIEVVPESHAGHDSRVAANNKRENGGLDIDERRIEQHFNGQINQGDNRLDLLSHRERQKDLEPGADSVLDSLKESPYYKELLSEIKEKLVDTFSKEEMNSTNLKHDSIELQEPPPPASNNWMQGNHVKNDNDHSAVNKQVEPVDPEKPVPVINERALAEHAHWEIPTKHAELSDEAGSLLKHQPKEQRTLDQLSDDILHDVQFLSRNSKLSDPLQSNLNYQENKNPLYHGNNNPSYHGNDNADYVVPKMPAWIPQDFVKNPENLRYSNRRAPPDQSLESDMSEQDSMSNDPLSSILLPANTKRRKKSQLVAKKQEKQKWPHDYYLGLNLTQDQHNEPDLQEGPTGNISLGNFSVMLPNGTVLYRNKTGRHRKGGGIIQMNPELNRMAGYRVPVIYDLKTRGFPTDFRLDDHQIRDRLKYLDMAVENTDEVLRGVTTSSLNSNLIRRTKVSVFSLVY